MDARDRTNSMVYIADVTGFGIIVFDYYRKTSWRVESQSTHLQSIPRYSQFTIVGEKFNLTDGVFGMAISPPNCKLTKSLISTDEYRVDEKEIQF